MGCCQSVPQSASAPPSPRPPHLNIVPTSSGESQTSHGRRQGRSSSSRNNPDNTGSEPSSPRRSAPRSPLPLSQPFNQPVRAHEWTGTHKPTRAHAADSAASARKTWTRRSLEREREAFFDTRVTGQPEVWATIRAATELVRGGDLDTAQSIVDAAEVTVPTGDLVDGAYDSRGAYYPLLEWVVADPTGVVEDGGGGGGGLDDKDGLGSAAGLGGGELEKEKDKTEGGGGEDGNDEEEALRKEAKGKAVLRASETFEVRARLSDRGGPGADVSVRLGKEDSVRVLTRRVKEEAGLPPDRLLRIAYMGKLLKENETLKQQGYRSGHMVNALVSE